MASACTNLNDARRVVQVLKIHGYSATTTMGNDGCIKSRWNVDGYEWEIYVYPLTLKFGIGYDIRNSEKLSTGEINEERMKWWDETRWLALRLVFLGTPREGFVRSTLACRLVDPAGVLDPSEKKCQPNVFRRPQDCSAAVVLIESRDQVASGYLKGDSLAVECAITVLRELPVQTIPTEEVLSPPATNLCQHLGELLQSGTEADITFIVSGESFPAHKNILSSRSPVFMAEFYGEMADKRSDQVVIEDMEAAAFRAMLHFIYTDTVPELDLELEPVATMAQHLLVAADRYGLDRLKLICEIKLSGGITVDTAATTLALAEQHNCSKLKAKCVEFIVSTPEVLGAVLATEGYNHLEASCPLVLTELLKSVHVSKS